MRFLAFLFCLSIFLGSSTLKAQAPDSLEPYFSSVLVANMDASKLWYTDVLGFSIVSENSVPDRFQIVNLKRGSATLELIELATALSPQASIPDYTAKTRLHGYFKMGYQVADLDAWVTHFQEKQVTFNGEVVADPVTGKRMVIVLDPDGNRIQLFER